MKNIFLQIAFLALTINAVQAQTVSQISSGAGYGKQAFYSLTTDKSTTVDNAAWDIAFSVYGQQDAGIFVNEASSTTVKAIELYKAPSNIFADKIVEADVKDRLYNDEQSWANGGFNAGRDLANNFDYGWATYNTTTKLVEGKKVFVLKLRNATYRKLEIQNLNLTKYTFRHSNLDGSDEKTATIDKKDFAGKTLAYFSLTTGASVAVEPSTPFDMLFTRYTSIIDQNGSGPTPYVVLGILTARGVQVAKATGIDPVKVNPKDYNNLYVKNIDVIGFDWKVINMATSKWEMLKDRVYFVKQTDGTIWKLFFVDFEGSATGTGTFEKTNLGKLLAINDISSDIKFNVFPTVAQNTVNIAFETAQNETMQISLFDLAGRNVMSQKITTTTGFQVYNFDVNNLQSGTYIVNLVTKNGTAVRKIIVE